MRLSFFNEHRTLRVSGVSARVRQIDAGMYELEITQRKMDEWKDEKARRDFLRRVLDAMWHEAQHNPVSVTINSDMDTIFIDVEIRRHK